MRQRVDLDRLLGVAVDLAADRKIYKYHHTTHTHTHTHNHFYFQYLLFQLGTVVVTNIMLVCNGQHFLSVSVHLFVSFENSKIHAVVKVMYTLLCHWISSNNKCQNDPPKVLQSMFISEI